MGLDNMDRNRVDLRRKYKDKKKSRFKKMMKECQKRSQNGTSELNTETYKYLLRILDVVGTLKDDEHEMEVLAGNVFREVQENEVQYAKTKVTSKLLEDLLPFARDEDFVQFIKPFTDNLRPIFADRTASHILQAIIIECFKRYIKTLSEPVESVGAVHLETTLKIAKFALNNLDTFIWDSSSNHVIRTILNVLSGHAVKGELLIVHCNSAGDKLPDEFHSVLEKLALAITGSLQFSEMCNQTLTSGLLQNLLMSTRKLEDTSVGIIKKIIKECKDNSVDFLEERNEPLLRLIETAIQVADEKQLKKICKLFFKQDLLKLAKSKTGNFAVQKLIKYCNIKETFDEIMDALQPGAEEIFSCGNTGIFMELAEGCLRLKSRQGQFVNMMMTILKCKSTLNVDSDISPLLCCMTPSDKFDPENMKFNLHGTLIIQAILNFNKPTKIINSLLNMEQRRLLNLLSDPRGCHITDAFMQSSYVGEKSRDRLFKSLLGCYTKLATSKHGSRSLDSIWNVITIKNKVLLMEELKNSESELSSNQFGRLFAYKIHLSHFRRNKEEWINQESTVTTTKRYFSDIIPEKKQKLN